MDLIKEIKRYLETHIDKNFNFELEHWENGNFDDSFEYGEDCGYQRGLLEIQNLINNLNAR